MAGGDVEPLGVFAEGRRHGEEALRLARAVRPGPPGRAYGGLGDLYLAQGDLEHAIRVLEQGLALCRASGNHNMLPMLAAGLGYAIHSRGRLAEGRALLEEAIGEGLRTARCAVMPPGRKGSARSVVWQDAARRPGSTPVRRSTWPDSRRHAGDEAVALHQLGVVYAHADPPDVEQAEAHYQPGPRPGRGTGHAPTLAHCHLSLGTLYATTGQRQQARTALSAAIALYRAMDMTFWLPQAEAALAQVQGQ